MKILNILSFLFFSFSVLGQWVAYDSVGATVASINKVSFPDSNTGYALGEGTGSGLDIIYKTNDGAISWTSLNFPAVNYTEIQNMHFVDTQTGFLSVREMISSNLYMKVYKTTDGAQNWSNISPVTASVGSGSSAVHFIDTDTGFFAIEDLMYKTNNSGQSWSVDTLGTMYHDITTLDFLNGQYGVAGGWDGSFAYRGVLFYTNDGGSNWNEILIPQTYSSIQDVQRVSPTNIYALGDAGYSTPPYLFRSIDSGATWDTLDLSQYAVSNMDNFTSLYFKDEMNGYIGTVEGNILKTIDAGQTWSVDYSFSGLYPTIIDIDFSGNTGYAFTQDGKIAKTGNFTAIQPIQISQEIRGFPNPASNRYYLDLGTIPDAKSINIYSLEGRLVFHLPFPKQQQVINTQNWPEGFYTGVVETEKGERRHFKMQKK